MAWHSPTRPNEISGACLSAALGDISTDASDGTRHISSQANPAIKSPCSIKISTGNQWGFILGMAMLVKEHGHYVT